MSKKTLLTLFFILVLLVTTAFVIERQGWETFSSEALRITLKYPNDWTVKEEGAVIRVNPYAQSNGGSAELASTLTIREATEEEFRQDAQNATKTAEATEPVAGTNILFVPNNYAGGWNKMYYIPRGEKGYLVAFYYDTGTYPFEEVIKSIEVIGVSTP